MNTFLTLLLVLTALPSGSVQFGIAPDQPVPHVYTDDPLIIELQADEDTEVDGKIEIEGQGIETVTIPLGLVELRAHGTFWKAVEDIPRERGRYEVRAHLTAGGKTSTHTATFCRVDRPSERPWPFLCFHPAASSPRALSALKTVGIGAICLDVGSAEALKSAAADEEAGFQVILLADVRDKAPDQAREFCANAASQAAGRARVWWVDAGESAGAFEAAAKALSESGAAANIAFVVRTPEELERMLKAGMGKYAAAAVCACDRVERDVIRGLRQTAAQCGYEGFRLNLILGLPAAGSAPSGAEVTQDLLSALALDIGAAAMAGPIVFEEDFGPAYPHIGGLFHRLRGAAYVGALELAKGVEARVFRKGQQWIIALWSGTPNAEVSVGVEGAAALALHDARNNPLPLPEPAENVLKLTVSAEPVFLSGKDGAILTGAARNEAIRTAKGLLDSSAFTQGFPGEPVDVVSRVASGKEEDYDRLQFFKILKLFPLIEQQWHTAGLSRSTAVPAIGALAHMARRLCTLEEEKGEPFVEPLPKTLDMCSQLQSLYLTGSTAAADAKGRADWILNEVSRLMAEAEGLVEQGRPIEAAGVAALAEWRARALDTAAKAAPLSEPESVPEPEPAPESEAQTEEPEEEAPKQEEAPKAEEETPEAKEEEAPKAEEKAESKEEAPQAKEDEAEETYHIIASGDNIYNIAKKYGVDWQEVLKVNKLSSRSVLSIGQKILIPKKKD